MNEQAERLPSAWSLFQQSIQVIRRNVWTFLGLLLVPVGGITVSILIVVALAELNASALAVFVAAVLFTLGSIALIIMVLPAFTVTALRSVDDETLSVEDAWRAGQPFVLKYLALMLILAVLFALGFLVFIVPYFWFYKRYMMAPYYLVNENVGPIEAMHRSARDAKRFSGAMWGVVGVTVIIELVYTLPYAGLPLGIILIVLYGAAPVIRYRQIGDIKAKDKPKRTRRKKPTTTLSTPSKRRSGKNATIAKQFED